MKHIRQVGVAGMIVASLAVTPGTVAASSSPRNSNRTTAQTELVSQRRITAVQAYQRRLTRLGAILEADTSELEYKLSRMAHGLDL